MPEKDSAKPDLVNTLKWDGKPKESIHESGDYIYTEIQDTTIAGESILLQNSYPKGGGYVDGEWGYTNAAGKNHAVAVFWTRLINETNTSLEVSIDFPADSFAVFSAPDAYLKVFLPPDEMTLNKQPLFNYGITDLRSFLDAGFDEPSAVRRTIQPREEFVFYTVMLAYRAGGTPRTEFVLQGRELYYKASVEPLGSAMIPCGRMVAVGAKQ